MAAISNEEELVQMLFRSGKREEEIAAILDIDLYIVNEYLRRPF